MYFSQKLDIVLSAHGIWYVCLYDVAASGRTLADAMSKLGEKLTIAPHLASLLESPQ